MNSIPNESVLDHKGDSCLLKDSCLFRESGLYSPGVTMNAKDIMFLKMTIIAVAFFFLMIIGGSVFMAVYPFKTVKFTGNPPIEVTNSDKKIPLGGVVTMKIPFTKYIDNPALIVKTLVSEDAEHQFEVLDSVTVVSTRKAGTGVSYATFPLNFNSLSIGKNRRIIFTIYYTLFGMKPLMVQYKSEPFEVTKPQGLCPPYEREVR
jgi:hypothetical protein